MTNCPNCHTQLPDDTTFCTECGTPINTSTSEPTASAQQQPPAQKPKNATNIVLIAVAIIVVVLAIVLVVVTLTGTPEEETSQGTSASTVTQQEATDQSDSASTNSNVDTHVNSSSNSNSHASTGSSDGPDLDDFSSMSVNADEKKLTNIDHGFSIIVPKNYQATSNDFGNTILIDAPSNGFHISIGCMNNTEHLNVQQCYDRLAQGHDVSYRFIGEKSCVASYTENGTIHYNKDIVGSGSILSIHFSYPESQSTTCDKLLEKIVDTVESGNLNTSHNF